MHTITFPTVAHVTALRALYPEGATHTPLGLVLYKLDTLAETITGPLDLDLTADELNLLLTERQPDPATEGNEQAYAYALIEQAGRDVSPSALPTRCRAMGCCALPHPEGCLKACPC